MAKLEGSSKNYTSNVLVYNYYQPRIDDAMHNLINAIWAEKKRKLALSKLQLKYGKHFYTPSDEWNQRFIRYKNYK
jgi:hypothetical protein